MQAVLGVFVRRVDLDVDVEDAVLDLEPLVEKFGQLRAVERVELSREARQVLRLVALQMADDAPVDGQVLQQLALAHGFLDLVLAEGADAGGMGEAQNVRRHGLGDGQQPHRSPVAPGPRTGGGDSSLHGGEIDAEGGLRVRTEALDVLERERLDRGKAGGHAARPCRWKSGRRPAGHRPGMVPGEGIEPPTFGLQNRCTTAVLTRRRTLRRDLYLKPPGVVAPTRRPRRRRHWRH